MALNKKVLCEYFNIDENGLANKKVRLFPTSKQPEQNIKHIFLYCLSKIKYFREELLAELVKPITNQTANLEAYSEITCDTKGRPDALLILTTGKTNPTISWTALIETKLSSKLEEEQVRRYYDFVKNCKIDSLITISNDPTSSPKNIPFNLKNIKGTECFHFSWTNIKKACLITLSEKSKHLSLLEKSILEEFVLYLNDDCVKVKAFIVSKEWKDDSSELFDNNIKRKKSIILDRVSSNWMQEEADLICKIYEQTGVELFVKNSNKSKKEYFEIIKSKLEKDNVLQTVFRNSNTSKNEVTLDINFSSRNGEISIIIPAEKEKGLVSQISTLLNKFKKSGEEHNIIFTSDYSRGYVIKKPIKELQIEKSRSGRSYSVIDKDKSIKNFKISMDIDFKRASDFHSSIKFDSVVESTVVSFFEQVYAALV